MSDHKEAYDLVCLVTNDIVTDRRMIRTCEKFASIGWKVLLIGRAIVGGKELEAYSFDTSLVRCNVNLGPLFYLEVIWRFRKLLKTLRFKRLLCTDLDSLGVLNIMSTKGVDVYYDAHEYFTEVPELVHAPIKRWIWTKWGRAAMKYVDTAYTVGPELATILGQKYNIEFGVIRNLPKRSDLPKCPKENPLLSLVYLGVLNPGRGLEVLIDVVGRRSDVNLRIIGDGPLEESLKARAKQYDGIQFLGKRSPAELPSILAEADLGVNLLVSDSLSYYYSLANKFFDYLHARLPVLCMNFPEYRNINSTFDCIYSVETLTIAELDTVIDSISKDSPNWQHKVDQSIAASAVYNWAHEGERLLELFGAK